MKSKLKIFLSLLIVAGMMIGNGWVHAEDYGIQESRVKIWKLLKEERPDYYGERETGQDRADQKVNYNDVEVVPSTKLVDEQNEFIANSLRREEIQSGVVWPSSPQEVPSPKSVDFNPEIAAAVEEQIQAAIQETESRPLVVTPNAVYQGERPKPISVPSEQPAESFVPEDKPAVKPFSSLWKKINSGDEATTQLSKAEVAQDIPSTIAETDEPVVVVPEDSERFSSDDKIDESRTVNFARFQADLDRAAEEEILRELIDDVAKSGKQTDMELAKLEDISPSQTKDEKSFLSGVKSFFIAGDRIVVTEAEASTEIDSELKEVAEDSKELREVLDDQELAAVASTARPTAVQEKEIVYTDEVADEDPSVDDQPVVIENLPNEILLAKVSDEPLKEIPNPMIITETKKEVLEATEEAKTQDIAMNQGVIYQQDIPETTVDEPKVKKPKKMKKAKKKAEPKKMAKEVKKSDAKPLVAEKAVSKKTIKEPKVESTSTSQVKVEKVEEETAEAEFIALRDSMRDEAAKSDKEEAPHMHEPEEDLMTKIKRKMSPSGLLEEEVAELDYWDVPVEEQKIDDISRSLKIDEAFKEASAIKLPENPADPIPDNKASEVTNVITPEEVVRNAIPVQNRGKKIDLDFDNTNLSDILLIMGEAGNMNIMLDPALKNNTLDLHLKQISLEDALLLIAQSYDLGFKLVGKALFITENEKLRFENKLSRMIKVRNINVQEAKNLVEDLADNVSVSEELNSLIVTGDPKDVAQVQKMVEMLDNPQPQVILEAKIIEVDKNALIDLGVDWSDQINVLYQESGRPQEFDDVENSNSGFYRISQLQRNPIQFETTIRMLETQNKAKVLSAPRVSTLNGKEAEIFVGDEVPYTITNITGGVVTNDVRFVEPGIRLTITPSIIEKNFVVMKVEPEVSFIVAFRGPNDEFPQVRTREATAHVRVEDKQPFVLGGILNQEDKQSLFKVPFFGDLPLFGNLFSYERNDAVDTELIITVIPTIVNGRD